MRRIILPLGVLLAALVTFAYLRPATILFAIRDVKLRRIGFTSHETRVGPHRIHYLTGGEGPPLVLVHGLAMTAKDWSPLLAGFAKTHRVYALDLLGSGDSDRPANAEYSIRQQTDIVRGFLDAMSLRQADVLGISMGGWIAMRLAAEHPGRVRRLVLVSSAGFDFPTDIQPDTFAPKSVADLHAMMARQTDRPLDLPDFIARDVVRSLQPQNAVVRRATASLLGRRDIMEGRVANVRMPVLLLAGTADRVVPFDTATRMKTEMPHAQLVSLNGCGHLAIVECRAAAMPAIAEFLR